MAQAAERISDIVARHISHCEICGNDFATIQSLTLTRDGRFVDGVYVLDNYTVQCPYCGALVRVIWPTRG